jgi:hypothetical protein
MLSMILQLSGLVSLITASAEAAWIASMNFVEFGDGKFDFW